MKQNSCCTTDGEEKKKKKNIKNLCVLANINIRG